MNFLSLGELSRLPKFQQHWTNPCAQLSKRSNFPIQPFLAYIYLNSLCSSSFALHCWPLPSNVFDFIFFHIQLLPMISLHSSFPIIWKLLSIFIIAYSCQSVFMRHYKIFSYIFIRIRLDVWAITYINSCSIFWLYRIDFLKPPNFYYNLRNIHFDL